MTDQADELRQLVLRTAAQRRIPDAPAPPILTVAGGRRAVGATTIAANLAVALARSGQRVVLVDADPYSPDATRICRVSEGDNLSDVLAGRRTVHEVLQRGPAGIQVLPGATAALDGGPLAQQRILSELARLGLHADMILLDTGYCVGPVATRFWQAAQQVLLVTTCEAESIMESYAAIKIVSSAGPCAAIRPIVNQAPSDAVAKSVQTRIAQACARFLEITTLEAHAIPREPQIPLAERKGRLLALHAPESPAAKVFDALAESITNSLNNREPLQQVA